MPDSVKMKFPLTLVIWPYLFFFGCLIVADNERLQKVFLVVYSILTIMVYLSNIAYACTRKGEDSYYHLAFWNMLIKLIHIPFYLFTFLMGVLFLLASVVPALIFVTPFIIMMLFIIDVFLMITSSIYGINALIRAGYRQVVSREYAVINSILHFIFVADVVSAVVFYIKVRKEKRAQ